MEKILSFQEVFEFLKSDNYQGRYGQKRLRRHSLETIFSNFLGEDPQTPHYFHLLCTLVFLPTVSKKLTHSSSIRDRNFEQIQGSPSPPGPHPPVDNFWGQIRVPLILSYGRPWLVDQTIYWVSPNWWKVNLHKSPLAINPPSVMNVFSCDCFGKFD